MADFVDMVNYTLKVGRPKNSEDGKAKLVFVERRVAVVIDEVEFSSLLKIIFEAQQNKGQLFTLPFTALGVKVIGQRYYVQIRGVDLIFTQSTFKEILLEIAAILGQEVPADLFLKKEEI